jgi:ankyrin repeat protein
MIAASKGMAHIVDFMIKLKVNVNQLNSKGQSALISALRFNHKDIVI